MRLAVVIPYGFNDRWLLRVSARSLARKHPGVVVLIRDHTATECLFIASLKRHNVPVTTPPPAPEPLPPPRNWWERLKRWRASLRIQDWDPVVHAEAVLLFWDGSHQAREMLQQLVASGKKVWVVRVTE